jgi:hypothetical protein
MMSMFAMHMTMGNFFSAGGTNIEHVHVDL